MFWVVATSYSEHCELSGWSELEMSRDRLSVQISWRTHLGSTQIVSNDTVIPLYGESRVLMTAALF